MGLMDILNGMQNGPRGASSGSGGGMSPVTMALLGLVAYKAIKGFSNSTSASVPSAGPRAAAPDDKPAGFGLDDLLRGGLGGTQAGAQGTGGLGGLLAGLGGGGLGGLPSRFVRIHLPRNTGEVRFGIEVTVRMLPCPRSPRRFSSMMVTRRKSVP